MPLRSISLLLGVVLVAGCGGSQAGTTSSTEILAGRVRPTGFTEVRRAVLALYRAHPAIDRFRVQDVEYTPATRDKVLRVCHEGGPEKSTAALESARLLACAPLVFFFYSYGRRASVPASVDVARKIYWYAVSSSREPYDARPGFTSLLRSWGIR